MSKLLTIKSLSQISSNVVTWFNANDINQSIGSSITSLTGREGKDSATLAVGSATLQTDASGFKCLRSNSSGLNYATATTIDYNNNETFIGVINQKSTGTLAAHILSDAITMGFTTNQFSYGSLTVGVGRIIHPEVLSKRLLTAVMTPVAMYVYDGFKLIATLSAPATLTGVSRSASAFRIDNNTTNVEVDWYCGIRIQEALSGQRLRQAIRSVAFENGVKI